MVVIDELSSFKNPQSQRFKALMKVRYGVKRIVGLTGTPASNGLMDLFAEYKLLDMGKRLGRHITRYRLSYFQPDKTNGSIVYSYKPLPFAEEEIYKKIGDITISMKSGDFLQMPEKLMTEYEVEMNEKEKAEYSRLKDIYLRGGRVNKNNDFVLSNGEFFELKPGRNKVQCTGLYLNRVWITPNWWTV